MTKIPSTEELGTVAADTLPKIMVRNYEQHGDKVKAMRHKQFGIWRVYTWKDYYENVKYFSLGLISLGLEAGDNVSVIGENAPEWIWSELAVQSAGGVVTGILASSVPSEVSYIVNHADSRFVVAEGQEQVDKLLMLKEKHELTNVGRVIYWNPKGLRTYGDPILISYKQVQELGKEYEKEHPGLFDENMGKTKGDDGAILVYTSGTSGPPKGVLTTHKALLAGGRSWLRTIPWYDTDEYVSFVSPALATEQYLCISAGLQSAFRLNFPEEPETLQADIKEISPHILVYNPRLWENMVSQVQAKMIDASRFNKLVYSMFFPICYKMADLNTAREKPNLLYKVLYGIADLMVLRPIRDTLGMNRVRLAASFGSVLSEGTFRMLRALGIDLRQCYALSETGLVTLHQRNEVEYQSAGPPQLGIEVRIADDGEILVRGQSLFSTYHKEPDVTNKALREGWLHTGDSGLFGEEGRVIFIGRMADLVEVNGHRVSPEYIEGRLKFGPYIKDAMVIGGKDRPYLIALILIDLENVGSWAQKNKLVYTTFADLSQKPEIYDLTEDYVKKANQALPSYSQIGRYCHLQGEFTPGQELTRSGKLKRQFTVERYRGLIDAMYAGGNTYKTEIEMNHLGERERIIETAITIRSV